MIADKAFWYGGRTPHPSQTCYGQRRHFYLACFAYSVRVAGTHVSNQDVSVDNPTNPTDSTDPPAHIILRQALSV